MKPFHERYPDLLGEQADPQLVRCVTDLDDTCSAFRLPARRDAAIVRALAQQMTDQRQRTHGVRHAPVLTWLSVPWRQTRGRLASVTLVLLLALSGAVGLLRLQSPTPVSAAQVILQRAAAALHAASSDQVIHTTYTITAPGGVTIVGSGTTGSPVALDVWIHRDASGALTEAITFSTSTGSLLGRAILTDQTATTYDAASNTIQTGAVSPESPVLAHPFDAASLAQVVPALAQGADQTARLLPPQTLDGSTVDVVEVNRTDTAGDTTPRTVTLYVDAHTYVLRRLDVTTGTAPSISSATVQLVRYATVPLADVPAHTFTLNAPATARVVGPPADPQQLGTQPLSVVQAVALPNGPALLLSGLTDGLRLRRIFYTRQPQGAVVSYAYHGAQKDLGVTISSGHAVSTMGRPPHGTAQPLTLTIAGQTVHATYYAPAASTHIVLYQQGTTGVRVVGARLSKTEFFRAVQALVDGRTHPALVAQLQHDLDAGRQSTTPSMAP